MQNEKLKIVVDDKGKTVVWMDGNIVQGIKSITFEYAVGDIPFHTIEFVTQCSGIKSME